LPAAARIPNGSSLKNELGGSSVQGNGEDQLEVLQSILGTLNATRPDDGNVAPDEFGKPGTLVEDIDFGDLSLEDYAASPQGDGIVEVKAPSVAVIPVIEDFEREKDKFENLHKSILACDEVLKSVETYLTSFRADLAAVSSEIEHLQDRSTALKNKLQNRKAVEKVLGPEVEAFVIPPAVVRKITEGAVDEGWVKALEELEKRSKAIESKSKDGRDIKAAQDIKPFINDISTKAVERIRDYVVAQIKALRSPSINAQIIQQNAFLRYRNVFGFLSSRQPELAEEISQAYINTMRWYYSSHFTRYKAALDKLAVYTVDQTETIGSDPAKKTKIAGAAHDFFSLGRRADSIRSSSEAVSVGLHTTRMRLIKKVAMFDFENGRNRLFFTLY
jgi:vacuolar protein sorting-associated protein 52